MSKDMSEDVFSALTSVTKQWKKEKRKADRQDRLHSYQYHSFYIPVNHISQREAAFQIMEKAYNKASANGRYYANARQIFYAARPLVLELTDKKSTLDSRYFTQTLLKDYLEMYSPNWKVVWDARGHFSEPHTDFSIGIGGIEVEEYIRKWHNQIEDYEEPDIGYNINTKGPANRYGAVLFIEKEGFDEILLDVGISKKYDLAIMSTKGIPVKAACDLIEALPQDIRVFVLHDFDKSGFTILKTLREGTRMARGRDVTDLGFRFADIAGLDSEPVSGRGGDADDYLRGCGATEEEISFLVEDQGYRGWSGQRVELNAMTSDQFISWLETKLSENKIEKVIPDDAGLSAAYQRAMIAKRLEEIIETEPDKIRESIKIPESLRFEIIAQLKKNPDIPWDLAVSRIVDLHSDEVESIYCCNFAGLSWDRKGHRLPVDFDLTKKQNLGGKTDGPIQHWDRQRESQGSFNSRRWAEGVDTGNLESDS
jgi:hypothetical protein